MRPVMTFPHMKVVRCAVLLAAICSGPAFTGCGVRVDTASEEKAVMEVLEAESRLAIKGDIDSLLSLYVRDEKNSRLSVTKTVSAMITGWDAIRKHQVDLLDSSWMEWEEKRFSKENVLIKISGASAWAVCDNVWQWREGEQRKRFQNIQITFLEKHRGQWKISFQAFVRDPEHMEVIDLP